MVVFTVNELEIQFPFVPYDVQKELMRKVVQCIVQRENGLLESPTGTGKTLSLLCAAVAWQKKQAKASADMKMRMAGVAQGHGTGALGQLMDSAGNPVMYGVPKIIYSSRTHTQLSQAARELKRSFYSGTKSVVLGSRDVMCIHDGVSRLPTSAAKIMGCHVQVKSRTCMHYNNVSAKKDEMNTVILDKPVMDIEDLVTTGRRNRLCPFFMSRELVKDAHVVFMPYNYLMDPKLRSSHGVDLKNSIIILDEGHNIAKMCEESVSFEIKNSTVTKCIQEVTQAMNDYHDVSQQFGESAGNTLLQDLDMPSLVMLKQAFLAMEGVLDNFKFESGAESFIPAQTFLHAVLSNAFPLQYMHRCITTLDAVSSFLAMSHRDASGCDSFSSVLRILTAQSMAANPTLFSESYRVYVAEEKKQYGSLSSKVLSQGAGKNVPKVFNCWCFNPGVGLEMMLQHGPRCIILASGTLSPLPFLETELRIPFPVKLTNPHIIGDSQLFATVVKAGAGPKNTTLSSAFTNRSNPEYLTSLGDVVMTTCSVVPKGVLVFFPSYSLMDVCVNSWKSSGLLDKLSRFKAVYIEPKGKMEFNQVMTNYYQSVKVSNGACLMAVCRGKVSEGIDFADDNGRAVIITGIPYAPFQDPQVQAKKNYLDAKSRAAKNNCLTGNNWYQLEAVRALNQAMGRIIRHAHDFGAVILCDERFDSPQVLNNLSPWLEKRIKRCSNFSDVVTKLSQFFNTSSKAAILSPPTTGGFQTQARPVPTIKAIKGGNLESEMFSSSSSGRSQAQQDVEMDCDFSSMYSQSSNKDTASSNTDLFATLDSLSIRPASDFVPTQTSTQRTSGLQPGKRSSSEQGLKQNRPKRIRMDVSKMQWYSSE